MNTDERLDFAHGVAFAELRDGIALPGRVGADDALLVRRGEQVYCIAAQCSHYHGPLAEGLLVGDAVRCPWHHACFDLRSGAALTAPALDALTCWAVQRLGERVVVGAKQAAPAAAVHSARHPASIVVVGGGAAGLAAVQTLRLEGYQGALTLLSADSAAPYDRPNLSKDYLAGSAPEEWLPLRDGDFYRQQHIDLRLNATVAAIDVTGRAVQLNNGERIEFEALLLATGAQPVQIPIPGAQPGQVLTLRTLADCRAILQRIRSTERVVILGASFIALEVAAALRERGIGVDVVGREQIPMARVLGDALGQWVQAHHASHGVTFHLQNTVAHMDGGSVTLADGHSLPAQWLIAGLGVRPAVSLAEAAGLRMDRGIAVDEFLQTSAPGIYAAGDIARWPDPHSGQAIRVEHWVLAQRQGQVAARNLLGQHCRFNAVPFFWSQHYDVRINYVGHAERWDSIEMDGSPQARDCLLRYRLGNRVLAVASIGRDRASLEAELAMESDPPDPERHC